MTSSMKQKVADLDKLQATRAQARKDYETKFPLKDWDSAWRGQGAKFLGCWSGINRDQWTRIETDLYREALEKNQRIDFRLFAQQVLARSGDEEAADWLDSVGSKLLPITEDNPPQEYGMTFAGPLYRVVSKTA